MQPLCCGVKNHAWSPSIMLSRHHPGKPCFKQNQVEDFLPKNNKQQQNQVRQTWLPPSLSYRGKNVWFPVSSPQHPPPATSPEPGWQESSTLIWFSKPLNITVGFHLSG